MLVAEDAIMNWAAAALSLLENDGRSVFFLFLRKPRNSYRFTGFGSGARRYSGIAECWTTKSIRNAPGGLLSDSKEISKSGSQRTWPVCQMLACQKLHWASLICMSLKSWSWLLTVSGSKWRSYPSLGFCQNDWPSGHLTWIIARAFSCAGLLHFTFWGYQYLYHNTTLQAS